MEALAVLVGVWQKLIAVRSIDVTLRAPNQGDYGQGDCAGLRRTARAWGIGDTTGGGEAAALGADGELV